MFDPVAPGNAQVCPVGGSCTVTAEPPPNVTGLENVNAPLALTVVGLPPLLSRVTCSPVARPVTFPPPLNSSRPHTTVTLLTLPATAEAAPCEIEQLCPVGCVPTVTA